MSSASTGGTEGSSPASSPASAASLAMAAPKYGTLVPNRIFVGGISASTSEEELTQLFSSYGNVKAVKIISDRAGVSKGYGFVTFETEEEAKRLQRESECIVLRERKLNIAPAIKKQPFNRSFDGGSGSPPAIPTSTYYYTNGMGLTYQNGVTFYNAGAPAPGTPVAPQADPATIYQATGVFGPQATAGHQTFAPMIYPCPAPSLYMPQQYQYSPVPYEPYYAGAAAAGAAQYLYTTSSSQNNASGGANGSGSSSNGTGATSPSAGPPQPLPSLPPPHPAHHFYAPAAPPPHHHPPVPTGPPPQQMDHLYYPFAAGPPPPHTQHAPLGLADQQLLLYTTDAPCQQQSTTSDGQAVPQEDSCSSSSHSERPHGETQAAQPSGTTAPLVSLMPVKFSMSGRYANYHPITIHTMNMHSPQQACSSDIDEFNVGQVHCRTIIYHPAAVYIPHTHASSYHVTSEVGSLLPTPLPTSSSSSSSSSQQTLESSPKIPNFSCREHSKVIATSTQSNSYVKSQNMSIALIAGVHQTNFGKVQTVGSQSSHKYAGVDASPKYPINALPSTRMPPHAYNKRVAGSNMGSPSYASQRSEGYAFGNFQKSTNFGVSSNFGGQTYSSACGSGMRRTGNHQNHDHANSRRSLNYGQSPYYDCASSYKASVHYNVDQSNFSGNFKVPYSGSHVHFEDPHNDRANESYNSNQSDSQITASTVSQGSRNSAEPVMSDKSVSPPPAPYSPMTRPLPTLSPPAPQVQFYAPAQNRYQPPLPPLQHQPQQQQQQQQQQPQQQQQQPAQRRYTVAPPLPTGRKPSEKYTSANSQNSILRQAKYKVNGIMQSGGKVSDDSLGGAGDAPPGVGRMPITPPGTPRTHPSHSASEQNQLSDACHQMQALSL